MAKAPMQKTLYKAIVYICNAIVMTLLYVMTSFTQVMPWAFKLCLTKMAEPSLLYMTVGLRVQG